MERPTSRLARDEMPLTTAPAKPRAHAKHASGQSASRPVLDLDRHVPYFFTNISIRLSRGASRTYLKHFGIGITEWRVVASLVAIPRCGPSQICQAVGLDKSAVSRSLKVLERAGYVRISSDPHDTRVQNILLTADGHRLHDQVIKVALAREHVLLSCLSSEEVKTLISALQKIREQVKTVNAYVPDAEQDGPARRKSGKRAVGKPLKMNPQQRGMRGRS